MLNPATAAILSFLKYRTTHIRTSVYPLFRIHAMTRHPFYASAPLDQTPATDTHRTATSGAHLLPVGAYRSPTSPKLSRFGWKTILDVLRVQPNQ
ncbi:MAG: hypothetical protein ACOCVG_04275 [Verrucomicrobiota bacterium]